MFARPRDRNEGTVAQGTFEGGLTGTAGRQVRRHAAIIAWLRSTMAPTSRVRLMQDTKRSKKPQVASEADLVDSTSEFDTSNPGGIPQLFRGPRALGPCPPRTPRMLPHRQTATRGFAPRPTVVTKPRKWTGGPTLLKKPERKIRTGGATDTGIVLRVARRAREEDN
jgi:hypothetical protein